MSHEHEIERRRTVTGIALKWGHIVILLIANLLAIGVALGTVLTKTDENSKRIDEKADHREVDQLRQEVVDRLDRIERKLDTEKDMRELDEVYRDPARRRVKN